VKKIYISGGTNKMQIPFLDSGNAGSGRPMAVDKNDQYVLKNCLAYLKRHFKRFPSYSRETCKMLVWTLGTDTERFVKFLMDQFERKNRLKYKKELMESDLDADDYAGIITKMLPRIGTRSQRRVFQQIMVQLEIRQKSASFEGKSDFEKNIMAIKEMFSLTDRETEFIVFLFIVSIYEGPQDYFVNHLECQKIIGQKYLANILGVTKTQLHSLLTGKLKKIGII
jgi:hypothetical protein